jgi:Leucine Rich repeat
VPMTPLTVHSAVPHPQSLPNPKRERFEVRRALRLALGVGLCLVFATLFAAFSIRVGRHLVAAWWFESLHCTVAWEIDDTNWRHGGATSVSDRSPNLRRANINDDDLDHVKELLRIVKLELAECDKITNTGLARLRGLDFLAELNLARLNRYRYARFGAISTPLTDACLIHLQPLRGLEKLTLAGNRITDKGLSQVASMANLKSLDLEATEVSDLGLVYLEGMRNLKSVNLGATRVTKEGLAKLQTARPDLTIELDVEPAVDEGVKLQRGVNP